MNLTPRRALRTSSYLLAASALALGTLGAGASAGASPVNVSPTGSIRIFMKGNGHGHGMSQYGAQGAAIAGRSYKQILSFYYPHTTLTRMPRSYIRVLLSGFGPTTAVLAEPTLRIESIPGLLPIKGVRRYRLIPGPYSGLLLQQLRGNHWYNYRVGVPNGVWFHRQDGGSMRLFGDDGTSTRYRGFLHAWRNVAHGSAGGVSTVNDVTLDRYTAGVVPREMPASWRQAAVNAQAVAARTYGRYAVLHPRGAHSDICDSTDCQVYGGMEKLDRNSRVIWTDDWPAALATSNQILGYDGRAAFTQFSASNGGWTASGGEPYLSAEADPYDNARSGDPYLSYSRTVPTALLGRYFGFGRLTAITITRRDGHGLWGGRVQAVTLSGYAAGHRRTVYTDGYGMQAALGMGTTWFTIAAVR